MTTPNKSMTPFEWLLLLTLSVLWGGSFFFGAVALEELPPLTLVLGRVGLAALALNLVIKASNRIDETLFARYRFQIQRGCLSWG